MTRERKSLLISAGVFALGAIDAYQTGDYLIAGASTAMALCNLAASALLERSRDTVQLSLFVLNAASALLMTYSTIRAGKQWLPYAWALAALIFLVIGWMKHGRRVFRPTDPSPGT